jgi:hypothetical protein
MDEYDPERDGELLKAGEVLKLLDLRSRASLPEWRERGDLIGFRMRSGHYRYPANQPALNEMRALQRIVRPQAVARQRAAQRRRPQKDD